MSRLRPYQAASKAAIFEQWQSGHRNVLLKSPTGSGKTVIFADIVRTVDRAAAVIAHRSELISQTSVALAREGVRHRVIGSDSLRRNCVTLHMEKVGRSFYDPGARVGVCGVDTLIGRDTSNDSWFNQVGLWVQDEAHHVLKKNKWGKAAAMFPNAYGLGVTATPSRADGSGLGRHSDGVFDVMVQGPEMRDLIDEGYLTDYRIVCIKSDVDYSKVNITPSGELSLPNLCAAVHASNTIVGDVVKHYLMFAKGKRGITFAVDVKAAKEINDAYRAAKIPSEIVTAKTPDILRAQIMRRFERGEVLQLVNVDLFGEGVDVPACEVVSMVRRTASWPLFVQQFGRALRVMVVPEIAANWDKYTAEQRKAYIAASCKPKALIIDHVGNIVDGTAMRHGLPDAIRIDTLNGRDRRSSGPSDAIPLRACANPNANGTGIPCGEPYCRYLKCCPVCNFYPEPIARSAPEFVDGDLFELDEATLKAMRGEIERIDGPVRIPQHLGEIAQAGVIKQHHARSSAQAELREQIALWAGWQKFKGHDDSQSYRIFYHGFGLDVLSAQALGRPEAEALSLKIKAVLDKNGIIKNG